MTEWRHRMRYSDCRQKDPEGAGRSSFFRSRDITACLRNQGHGGQRFSNSSISQKVIQQEGIEP
eukprot:6425-Eustigmatos_ZCMA.PRE.1